MELTPTETAIFNNLVSSPDGLSHEEIIKIIEETPRHQYNSNNISNVHIKNIRKKLEAFGSKYEITTLKGRGYMVVLKK